MVFSGVPFGYVYEVVDALQGRPGGNHVYQRAMVVASVPTKATIRLPLRRF